MYYNGVQTNVEIQLSFVSNVQMTTDILIMFVSIIYQVWDTGIQIEARMTV